MSKIYVDCEYDHWVYIPMDDEEINDTWKNEKQWARSSALVLRSFNGLPESRKEEKEVAAKLIAFRHEYKGLNLGDQHYAYFSHPSASPLPILVASGPAEGDRDTTLRQLSRADSEDTIMSPQVEDFTSNETLGAGLRTRTYVELEDQTVLVNLWYAFRSEEHDLDVVAVSSSPLLGEQEAAEPDFDDFIRGIWVLEDDVDLLEGFDDPEIDQLRRRDS